jgi:hypothetical protein
LHTHSAGGLFLPHSAGEMWVPPLAGGTLLHYSAGEMWLALLHEVKFSLTLPWRLAPYSAWSIFLLTLQKRCGFLTLQEVHFSLTLQEVHFSLTLQVIHWSSLCGRDEAPSVCRWGAFHTYSAGRMWLIHSAGDVQFTLTLQRGCGSFTLQEAHFPTNLRASFLPHFCWKNICPCST